MSGVCPAPKQKAVTDFANTGTFTVTTPAPRLNNCEPAQTVNINDPSDPVVVEKCCEIVGPPGPQGPAGAPGANGTSAVCAEGYNYTGDWEAGEEYKVYNPSANICNTDLALGSDSNLYICIQAHTSANTNEPPTGAEWETYWKLYLPGGEGKVLPLEDGKCYKQGQLVEYENCIYKANDDVCVDFNDPGTMPDKELDGGLFWDIVSCEEERSWLDNLLGGDFDWIKTIGLWGLSQFLGSFVADLFFGSDDEFEGFTAPNFNTEFNTDPEDAANIVDTNYKGTPTVNLVTGPTLQQVVARICELSNIANTQYDVSLLPNTEVNMILGNTTSGRSVLDLLSLVYQFGIVDSEKVKFVPHTPAASVRTLTVYDDLGFGDEFDEPKAPINIKRLQGYDLPREVNLTYQSRANLHETFVQTATLETMEEGIVTNLEVPITLTEQQAYSIAENVLVNSHIGRTTYSFTTSYNHIDLEPEDIITLDGIGDIRIIRIEENIDGGLLTIVGVDAAFNDYAHTASPIAPTAPPTYSETPLLLVRSSGIVVENPTIAQIEPNKLRVSIAPHAYGADKWVGCDVYYSTDKGETYTYFQQVASQAIWGKATSIESVSNHLVMDKTSTIAVDLKVSRPLPSSGLCMIGQEIVQYNTATLSGSTWVLTDLYRGRLGTEQFISTHAAEEPFILLDEKIISLDLDPSEYGKLYLFKFVTRGSPITSATAVPYVINGKSRRPWPVADLQGVRGDDNRWTITWEARNQFNGDLIDSNETAKPDNFGGYVINILGPGNIVKRSFTQQTNQVIYTSQQQIEDFGIIQSTLKIDIAQIDRIVGTGYNTIKTFTG
jgi:hypothetical protein